MDGTENSPMWSPYAKIYDPLQSGSIDGTDTIPHDRALIRAMEAKYVPPNKNVATPDAEKTLFVGRLDHKTTEEDLKGEFSRYGTVTHCRVVKDVVTGFSRGYAFVQFKHYGDAERARQDAHRKVLDGREVLVEWENGRTMAGWIPRRLGGGFGGKKESGQLRFGGRHRPFRKPIVIALMRKDRALNLDEEEVKPFRKMDRQPAEDEEESERKSSWAENQWNDSKELRNYKSSSSQFPRKNFSKPWNRRNLEYSCGRERRSSRDHRDSNEAEDRRWSGKSFKDLNEWDSCKRRDRDRCFSKSSRDQLDGNEREDPNAREDRRYSSKSSRDRGKFEERDDTQRRPHKLDDNEAREERSRKSRDREYPDEWEESYEGRFKKMSDRSRRSRDREDPFERDDWSEKRLKNDGKQRKSSNDRNDMGDWDDTPERSDKDKNRRISSKDPEGYNDSHERSKNKKRSRWSQDRSDTDERDDGHEQKSKKKKKKSKKLSRDHDNSDDSYERKKEKKKKKHKKSRD